MSRPLLDVKTHDPLPTVYRAELSDKIHCLHCCWSCVYPCSCLCVPLISDLALESTYVHVHSNRLEYNYPTMTVTWDCHCHVVDDIQVLYFDRLNFSHVDTLDMCCCGCENTVLLSAPTCSCATVKSSCCGRLWLHCLAKPEEFIHVLTQTRTRRYQELNLVMDMER